METLAGLAVPIVSAVRGPVAGIGCSLALAADFCVASETAYFLQAFVNIGLVPDGGASWMLPRLVGRASAAEMMMLGERIPEAKALDRSEENTSELQSLMRSSYAVFCLHKKQY